MKGALQKIGWKLCSIGLAHFSFAAEESDEKKKVTACPVDAEGPGWTCRIDGHQLVSYICRCLTMVTLCMKALL